MFARRQPRTRAQKLRNAIWPDMGWRRFSRYLARRVVRLPGTPAQIAGGFAAGVSVSFTPFVGFHIAVGAAACWMLRLSVVSMILGTVVAGNFWTFPLIFPGTYALGKKILGSAHDPALVAGLDGHFTFSALLEKPAELLLPMTVGSVFPALVFGALSFYVVRDLVVRHRRNLRKGADA